MSGVEEITTRYPEVIAWHGTHTNRWWAITPTGDRLVEGATVDELAERLQAVMRPPRYRGPESTRSLPRAPSAR